MSIKLLDLNVLIARQDADHEHHERVCRWMRDDLDDGWATCPLTENGFVRILGHSSYPGWAGNPERAAIALRRLIAVLPGHAFLADEVSLLDTTILPSLAGVGSRSLTDLYLLALALHHGVVFATLDARINPGLVPGGPAAFLVVP